MYPYYFLALVTNPAYSTGFHSPKFSFLGQMTKAEGEFLAVSAQARDGSGMVAKGHKRMNATNAAGKPGRRSEPLSGGLAARPRQPPPKKSKETVSYMRLLLGNMCAAGRSKNPLPWRFSISTGVLASERK